MKNWNISDEDDDIPSRFEKIKKKKPQNWINKSDKKRINKGSKNRSPQD